MRLRRSLLFVSGSEPSAHDDPLFTEDIEVVVTSGAAALVIPKVESADDIHLVVRHLKRAERRAARAQGSVRAGKKR